MVYTSVNTKKGMYQNYVVISISKSHTDAPCCSKQSTALVVVIIIAVVA
jgi:hypothetical protein